MSAVEFQGRLEGARDGVLRAGQQDVPGSRHAQALAKRLRAHGASYFTFVTTPGVEPTNNLAEQAVRFVVIDRHITQGTRSEAGRRWCERIWSVIASCTQQGRSVFDYLEAAVRAYFVGGAAPSLLPGGEEVRAEASQRSQSDARSSGPGSAERQGLGCLGATRPGRPAPSRGRPGARRPQGQGTLGPGPRTRRLPLFPTADRITPEEVPTFTPRTP
jgi:hypothetical protein